MVAMSRLESVAVPAWVVIAAGCSVVAFVVIFFVVRHLLAGKRRQRELDSIHPPSSGAPPSLRPPATRAPASMRPRTPRR
jgi:hypothetical protein